MCVQPVERVRQRPGERWVLSAGCEAPPTGAAVTVAFLRRRARLACQLQVTTIVQLILYYTCELWRKIKPARWVIKMNKPISQKRVIVWLLFFTLSCDDCALKQWRPREREAAASVAEVDHDLVERDRKPPERQRFPAPHLRGEGARLPLRSVQVYHQQDGCTNSAPISVEKVPSYHSVVCTNSVHFLCTYCVSKPSNEASWIIFAEFGWVIHTLDQEVATQRRVNLSY